MDERPISPALKVMALVMFLFLLAPLIVVVPISFSGDSYVMFPPTSWSIKWYGAIFRDGKIVSACWTGLLLAAPGPAATRSPSASAARQSALSMTPPPIGPPPGTTSPHVGPAADRLGATRSGFRLALTRAFARVPERPSALAPTFVQWARPP